MNEVELVRWGERWVNRLTQGAVRVLLLMGSLWLSGCYHFVRVDPGAAPQGARVRAELTAQGAERLAPVAGNGGPRSVEGRLVELTPEGSLLLEVSTTRGETPVGVSGRPLFSRVTVTEGELIGLELKKLHPTRTAAFVAGGALLAGILVGLAFDTYGSSSGEGQGPIVDEAHIPLFTIRW